MSTIFTGTETQQIILPTPHPQTIRIVNHETPEVKIYDFEGKQVDTLEKGEETTMVATWAPLNPKIFPRNDALRYDDVLHAMLLALNKPEYLAYFPSQHQRYFSEVGQTAISSMDSNIRMILESMAYGVHQELLIKLSKEVK